VRRIFLAVLVVVASLGLVAGGVLAGSKLVAPTTDGTFWACYDNGGSMKLVADDAEACPKNWNGPVHWAQGGSLMTRLVREDGVIPDGAYGSAIAFCSQSEVVLGGGFVSDSINALVGVQQSEPVEIGGVQGWAVTMTNYSGQDDVPFQAYAICTPGTATGS
jgi:hypothetical protein